MEMVSTGARLIASIANHQIRPLKRIEYDKLAAEGFFDDEKVELLFGMVVAMAPIDPEHNESVETTRAVLERQLEGRARVSSQCSFAASDDSEPEPDIFVIPNVKFWHQHPDHAFLVVEIARSSLERDRAKQYLYANGGVDEYWIVNHADECVEVFREASAGTWKLQTRHGRGSTLRLLAFPDMEVLVDEILPPDDTE